MFWEHEKFMFQVWGFQEQRLTKVLRQKEKGWGSLIWRWLEGKEKGIDTASGWKLLLVELPQPVEIGLVN